MDTGRRKIFDALFTVFMGIGFLLAGLYWLVQQELSLGGRSARRSFIVTAHQYPFWFYAIVLFWIVFGIIFLRLGIKEVKSAWKK